MASPHTLNIESKPHSDETLEVAPKTEIDHVELDEPKVARDIQLKSELDSLSIGSAFTTFKWSALICGLAGFSANSLTSGIIANAGFKQQFGIASTNAAGVVSYALNPTWVSTFGGMFSAGQVIGQFSIQWVSDWVGRKGAMWTFMALVTLAVIVECVSSQWWHFTIAKFIAGVGIGSVQATLPVYINEHAPVQIRGFLVVAYSLWFSLGGLLSSIALSGMNTNSPYDWRTPIYTQFGFIGLALIMYVFLPESPWWLASKGKLDQARQILAKKNSNIPNYDLDAELNIIVYTIELQKQEDARAKAEGPWGMFKGLNGKRFLIGSWPKVRPPPEPADLQVLQQFVGLGVFSSYSTYFFQLAGNSNPFNATVIQGCCSLLAVILDANLVDRIGRRRMTLIGFTGACSGVTMMAIIGCFDYTTPQLGAALVFSGVVANFCNTFQSSTSYAYLTEMPEQRFRARATGWGLAYCNLFAVLFNFTIPLMLNLWVVKTAFLFMGLGIPGTVLAYFIMPESMGRSAAEIDEMFHSGVPLRKWRGYKTEVERNLEGTAV